MAIQKKVDLNEPLEAEAKSTLSRSPLTPELAEASLRLHGDYYKQLQGKLNRHIFWHPLSVFVVAGGSLGYFVYALWDYVVISSSIREFLAYSWNDRNFKFQLTTVFPALIISFGVIGISSYFLSREFRIISDNLPNESYIEQIYGFDLRKFAQLTGSKFTKENRRGTPKETRLIEQGNNSIVIIYKDSPIAIITLLPLLDKSSESNFYVRITGLHVRKVFAKVDFQGLLLEWSIIKSREMYQKFTKNKVNVDGCKITIYSDAFSFDKDFTNTLKQRSFSLINETCALNRFANLSMTPVLVPIFFLALKIFDIKRQTYGITFVAKNGDDDLILQAAKNSELLKNKKKQN